MFVDSFPFHAYLHCYFDTLYDIDLYFVWLCIQSVNHKMIGKIKNINAFIFVAKNNSFRTSSSSVLISWILYLFIYCLRKEHNQHLLKHHKYDLTRSLGVIQYKYTSYPIKRSDTPSGIFGNWGSCSLSCILEREGGVIIHECNHSTTLSLVTDPCDDDGIVDNGVVDGVVVVEVVVILGVCLMNGLSMTILSVSLTTLIPLG